MIFLKSLSHSVLMISWSCTHMAWWLLTIPLSWASDQRLPLPWLQEAHTLFLYFLLGNSDSYLICVWRCETVPGGWLQILSQPHSPWMHPSQMRPHCSWHCSHRSWSLVLLKFTPLYHCQDQWWPWLDWRRPGRSLPWHFRAVPSLWCPIQACPHCLL